MKRQTKVRFVVWLALVANLVVWVVLHRPIHDVVTLSPAFWWGVVGFGVLVIWAWSQIATNTLDHDLEAMLPRDPWRRSHALGRRVKRLERELLEARAELATVTADAQNELDELGKLAVPPAPSLQ